MLFFVDAVVCESLHYGWMWKRVNALFLRCSCLWIVALSHSCTWSARGIALEVLSTSTSVSLSTELFTVVHIFRPVPAPSFQSRQRLEQDCDRPSSLHSLVTVVSWNPSSQLSCRMLGPCTSVVLCRIMGPRTAVLSCRMLRPSSSAVSCRMLGPHISVVLCRIMGPHTAVLSCRMLRPSTSALS